MDMAGGLSPMLPALKPQARPVPHGYNSPDVDGVGDPQAVHKLALVHVTTIIQQVDCGGEGGKAMKGEG